MSLLIRPVASVAASAAVLLLAGCSSLSGLDGTSSYGCKAPEGVKCDSVSGTYHNAVQNNLPSQRRSPMKGQPGTPAAPTPAGLSTTPAMINTAARTTPGDEGPAYSASPLRASPKVMRLWIKSWEDADRDLNGESLVYVQVDNGRWLVDHVQRQSREAFAPVRPGNVPALKSSAADPGKTSASPAGTDDPRSLTQALRALQGRLNPASGN